MRAAIVVIATLSFIAPTAAQQAAPFCQAGFDAVLRRSGPLDADVVFRNCAPGNSIVIPNANSIAIAGISNAGSVLAAQVCDFSKQIFVVPGNPAGVGTAIVCIVAGRPSSQSPAIINNPR